MKMDHNSPLRTPTKVDEMRTDTISGLLQFIAYQAMTGEELQWQTASSTLTALVTNLPMDLADRDEALTLQALALSFAFAIQASADDPSKVRNIVSHLIPAIRSAGSFLELLAGATLEERQFFDEAVSTTVQ